MNNSLPEKKFSPENIDLVEINVELDNLGWDFHNYRILNLTDIHLGQWINPEYLEDLIDYVNTLNYDLATLTGDYFSYIISGYEGALEKSLSKLSAPDGKFGVLGNHDHWMGADKVRRIFKNSDVVDLSNDVCLLSKGGDELNLAGVDSCTVGEDDLDEVLGKLKKDIPSILLAHEPDFAVKSSKTHAFFRGPNSTKYPVGLYKIKDMIQYTSKGLGTNVFRVRINCKPEITILTLKTKNKRKIEIE